MATPLTDGINALTQYANEVTGASDTNLSDAVYTLAQGYGQSGDSVNYLSLATSVAKMFSMAKDLPQIIEFDASNMANTHAFSRFIEQAYESGQSSATIDVIIHFPTDSVVKTSLYYAFFQAYGVRSVTIDGDLSKITWYNNMFSYCGAMEEINIVFDFSSCTDSGRCNLFPTGSNSIITKLRFVPNTLSYSTSFSAFRALDADSLVSLANCLNAEAVGQTLTLYSTQYNMCSSITGTVTDGMFTADESGTVTLADFITTVKGWTLA